VTEFQTTSSIEQFFSRRDLNIDARIYLRRHTKRFLYLLETVKELRANFPQTSIRICDVGPSFFTELLSENFPSDTILSIGYEHEQSRGGHLPEEILFDKTTFHHFDLNEAQKRDKWLTIPPCEIIVIAEVIEHLHVAPTLVLQFLHSLVSENGFLIIQTPNAASTMKRLLLLFGRNPYEMLRENAENPGHIREYTKKELCSLAEQNGFRVVKCERKNYFARVYPIEKVYGVVQAIVPPSFKDGITLVLQKSK
jgi:hypothetical protein